LFWQVSWKIKMTLKQIEMKGHQGLLLGKANNQGLDQELEQGHYLQQQQHKGWKQITQRKVPPNPRWQEPQWPEQLVVFCQWRPDQILIQ
jgi:hypothetical protein